MSNPWCVTDVSFQHLKIILGEDQEEFHISNKENKTNLLESSSINALIRKLQEADKRVLELRESNYKAKIALDYSEVVIANNVISQLARTLDKLVCDLQGLNSGNALQIAYERLLYQVGLIKCDMTSENRCKTLQAIKCAVQSTKQLLSETDVTRSIISPFLFENMKTKSKMLEELDQIDQTIGMFGTDDELSIDDIMEVIQSLTNTLRNANLQFPSTPIAGVLS
jgi:hypothetical protein